MNIKQPKKHHYVPQFLLRNFSANKNEQIFVLDKNKKCSFTANIKEIGHENNFYKDDIMGYENKTEFKLSNLESKCSPIISQINRQESITNLNRDDLYTLSFFVTVQLVRTKNSRNYILGMNQEMASLFKEQGLNPDEDFTNFKTITKDEAKSISIDLLNTAPKELVNDILNKIISLVKAPSDEYFYISDNPIVMHNHFPRKNRGNLGIGLKGIEIHFPISPKLCLTFVCPEMISEMREGLKKYKLILNNTIHEKSINKNLEFIKSIDDRKTRELKPENIEFHNSLQVNQSTRFIYSNNNEFILAKDMMKTNPNLGCGKKYIVR